MESNFDMAKISGMKAFGLLEDIVLDALAVRLKQDDDETSWYEGGRAKMQYEGFWEKMLLSRKRKQHRERMYPQGVKKFHDKRSFDMRKHKSIKQMTHANTQNKKG